MKKILVGFDDSDGGRDALNLVRTLASISEATVVVATVLPYGPFPVGFEELQDDAAAKAEPLFEEARESLAHLAVESRGFGGGSPALASGASAQLRQLLVQLPANSVADRLDLGVVALGGEYAYQHLGVCLRDRQGDGFVGHCCSSRFDLSPLSPIGDRLSSAIGFSAGALYRVAESPKCWM